MKYQRTLTAATLLLTLTLAGWGGGGGGNDNGADNGESSPQVQIDSFFTLVKNLIATRPDNTEPVAVGAFTATTPENSEPTPLS